jgi:hypothetical protein
MYDVLWKSEYSVVYNFTFSFQCRNNGLQPVPCECVVNRASGVLLWVSGVMALAWPGQAGLETATSRVTSREIHPYPSQPPRLTSTTTARGAPPKHLTGLPRPKKPLKSTSKKATFVSAPCSRRQSVTRIDCTRGLALCLPEAALQLLQDASTKRHHAVL